MVKFDNQPKSNVLNLIMLVEHLKIPSKNNVKDRLFNNVLILREVIKFNELKKT